MRAPLRRGRLRHIHRAVRSAVVELDQGSHPGDLFAAHRPIYDLTRECRHTKGTNRGTKIGHEPCALEESV